MQETQVQSLGQEDPLEGAQQPTPVFFPGKAHGQRRLEDYCPWGSTEPEPQLSDRARPPFTCEMIPRSPRKE